MFAGAVSFGATEDTILPSYTTSDGGTV
jgi:hypothetical protein